MICPMTAAQPHYLLAPWRQIAVTLYIHKKYVWKHITPQTSLRRLWTRRQPSETSHCFCQSSLPIPVKNSPSCASSSPACVFLTLFSERCGKVHPRPALVRPETHRLLMDGVLCIEWAKKCSSDLLMHTGFLCLRLFRLLFNTKSHASGVGVSHRTFPGGEGYIQCAHVDHPQKIQKFAQRQGTHIQVYKESAASDSPLAQSHLHQSQATQRCHLLSLLDDWAARARQMHPSSMNTLSWCCRAPAVGCVALTSRGPVITVHTWRVCVFLIVLRVLSVRGLRWLPGLSAVSWDEHLTAMLEYGLRWKEECCHGHQVPKGWRSLACRRVTGEEDVKGSVLDTTEFLITCTIRGALWSFAAGFWEPSAKDWNSQRVQLLCFSVRWFAVWSSAPGWTTCTQRTSFNMGGFSLATCAPIAKAFTFVCSCSCGHMGGFHTVGGWEPYWRRTVFFAAMERSWRLLQTAASSVPWGGRWGSFAHQRSEGGIMVPLSVAFWSFSATDQRDNGQVLLPHSCHKQLSTAPFALECGGVCAGGTQPAVQLDGERVPRRCHLWTKDSTWMSEPARVFLKITCSACDVGASMFGDLRSALCDFALSPQCSDSRLLANEGGRKRRIAKHMFSTSSFVSPARGKGNSPSSSIHHPTFPSRMLERQWLNMNP